MNFQFKPKNLKINSQKINEFLSKNANVNFNNKKYVFKQLDRYYDNSIIASILSKDEKTKYLGIIDKLEYPICIINADELFPKKDENDENKIIDYNNYVKKLTKNK